MKYKITVVDLESQGDMTFLENIIIPIQTHSNNIIEIKTGFEDLSDCDGVLTSSQNDFKLSVYTADCAAICFYDHEKYGVVHAGWRGLVGNIIEKMLQNFTDPAVFVSPLLNEFEIHKDDCYEKVKEKFGEKYFYTKSENNKEVLVFKFLEAVKSILPQNTVFDLRDTFQNKNLASWRRDGTLARNYTIISRLKN